MTRPRARGVRIIGGRWRGTRVEVDERDGLRPSADRVRETLFNWLQPYLSGARCLDLFAGTGVLGFEAVSRGAASALLLDRDPDRVAALERLKSRLAAESVSVQRADALEWLRGAPSPFDIVFIDPPFTAGLAPAVLERLARGWLAPAAQVYVESGRGAAEPGAAWRVRRAGTTRHVSYRVIERAD